MNIFRKNDLKSKKIKSVENLSWKIKCLNILKQKTPTCDLKIRKCDIFMAIMTKMTKYDFIDQMRQNVTFYDLKLFTKAELSTKICCIMLLYWIRMSKKYDFYDWVALIITIKQWHFR